MRSSLDDILTKDEKKDNNKLNLFIISEAELATKLTDQTVYSNLADLIEKYPEKIDAIMIKGGIAYIADKYSKRRAEYLDMLEDNIRGKYGEEAYRYVKGKNAKQKDHGSVNSFGEALRLAKYTIKDLVNKAAEKGIPIYYEYGDKDYNNVNALISVIYNLIKKSNGNYNKNDGDNKKKNLAKIIGTDLEMLSKIENFGFDAERWKNKDKNGIKDIAVKIYNSYITEMLSPMDESKKTKVIILNGLFNEFSINGFNINSTHAINGRENENYSFITPLQTGQKRAIEYANRNYQNGGNADIYLRTHDKGGLDFTAIEFKDKKPIVLLCTPPLQDPDILRQRSNSWSRTVDAKRFDAPFDSGVVILKIDEDKRIFVKHIEYNTIKKKIDPVNLENSMYRIITIGDLHIGAPSLGNNVNGNQPRTAYELMEAAQIDLSNRNFDRNYSYISYLGDIMHGGIDKVTRSDILENKRYGYEKTIRTLDNLLSKGPLTKDEIRRQLIEEIYGVSIPNLGEQIKEAAPIVSGLARSSSRAGVVRGNHVSSAALNENEDDIIGAILETSGVEVDYPNKIQQRNETYKIFDYPANGVHSTGYRGWKDGGRENIDMVYDTGINAVIQLSADEHRPHLNIVRKFEDGREFSLVAIKPPAFQDYTTFERNVVKKNESPRGYSILYLPRDINIGTGYIVYELVTEATLDRVLIKNGGSKIDKLVDKMYSLINTK